jgi:hypothetical protein
VLGLTALNVIRPRDIVGEGGVNPGFPLPEGGSTESHAAIGVPSRNGAPTR